MKFLALTSLAAVALLAPAAAQELVAVKAGRLVTITSGDLDNATVLIENGKIKAIGRDVEIPWNAKVIDASDKVVAPTYVLAHTSGGMSGANENMVNVPFLTVQDGVDPSSRFFEEALRNGVGCMHVIPGHRTLIGGTGMIARPYGKTVEDMAIRTKGAMKVSLSADGGSRMAKIHQLRRALKAAIDHKAEHERKRAEFEKEKAAGATAEQEFSEQLSPLQKPVIDLIEGKVGAHLYVPSSAELGEVERMKKEHGLAPVLVLGPRCYQDIDRIKALGLPVVLDASSIVVTEKDPDSGEEKTFNQARLLDDAGIPFALSISTGTSGAERYPWWQMSMAIRGGVDRDTALRALTVEPARIIGLADELGSIEPGKVANLQILTGDPLKATSWVDTVLLEGEVVYERSADRRLQRLFGQDQKKGQR